MGTELEDYTSYIKTQDSIFLQFHTSSDAHNYAIASEGFGTETLYLTSTSSSEMIPFNLAWQVEFVVDSVCSVHALAQSEGKTKTKRAVLYGNAIKLKHSHSDKFLSCKGNPWNRDKLSYTIHLQQEDDNACWFVIVPGQVTRSEGEKVRFGDDVLLKSISYDRFLCAETEADEDLSSSPMTSPDPNFWMNPSDTESSSFVIASFKKTLWCLQLFTSNVAREQDIGFLCGQEPMQFFCRHTTSYLMAGSEEGAEGVLKFEPTNHKNEVQSIWRIELLQLKWGGLHLQWGQPFRLRHLVTGKFLGSKFEEDKNRYVPVLLSEEKSNYQNSVFSLRRSVEDVSQWEQREDQFFKPQIKLGDSQGLLQHFPVRPGARGVDAHPLWLGFTMGAVEESRSGRLAMFLSQGINYKYALTVTTTSSEKSKGATNVYITDRIISTFRKIVSQKPLPSQFGPTCKRLIEILKEFSSHFDKFTTHEGLFKSFLSLASHVERIYKNSFTSGPPKLSHARLSRGSGSPTANIKEIKSSLLETLAEFLKKHNPECCRHFAQSDNLELFLSMVEDPKYNRDVLKVLLNAFHENSEILNSFKETYIDQIIMLFSSFGRNEKILELLTSLCLCNGTAIRRNQNVICDGLLRKSSIQDLLLRTIHVNKMHVMRTSFCISRHPDSATYPKWYFELEVEQCLYARPRDSSHFRVGWISLDFFSDLPSYDSSRTGEGSRAGSSLALSEGGVGDDLYSYGFDGRFLWTGGIPFRASSAEHSDHSLKSVIGCYIDLSERNMSCWFSLNGELLEPRITGLSSSQMVCPAVSFSSDIRCHFRLGDKFGEFVHTPDPDFIGIASARSPSEDGSLEAEPSDLFSFASSVSSVPPGRQTEEANSFRIEGPAAIQDDCSFVPTPIDVSDVPPSRLSLTEHIAEYLHDVWAVNKIESGWDFGERRDDAKKLHPLLIPFAELTEEQKQYDLDLAQETIKTLKALGYDMKAPSKEGFRAKKKPLEPSKYELGNGYLPALYNLDALEELPALRDMIERLAENTHHLWARNKVSNGFCYGSNAKNASLKVSSLLVPYERLCKNDKKSNRDSVKGVIEALIARGYSILSMRSDHEILELARNVDFSSIKTTTYRTQTSYGVSQGLWYYDVTLETAGFMRIGWATSAFRAGRLLGSDVDSYAYDGYLARKWSKTSVTFGQRWKSGDRIRCFLNLKEGTICFACNDSLLRGADNDTIAFSDIPHEGVKYYPTVSLGRGQRVEISFLEGKGMRSYELVDEYSPFSSGVHTSIPLWYSLEDFHYDPISSSQSSFRLSPDVDPLILNEMSVQLKSLAQDPQPECLRLNLGVPLEPRSPEGRDNLVCFGVRVQISDIDKAYLGWTTSSFKFFPGESSHGWGQECLVSGDTPTRLQTAYLMPLSKLTESTQKEEHLEVYTVLDRERRVITYHLSYDSECKESLQYSPTIGKLFPTFIISPSKHKVDFLLDPLTNRISLASAILPPGSREAHRSRIHWFAWMELQVATAYSWTYRENCSIQCSLERAGDGSVSLTHEELPASPTGRGGVGERLAPPGAARKLVKMHPISSSFESTDSIGDCNRSLYVLIPEEETLFRFTDISERPVLANFLTQSFRLFNAICYHVFSAAVDSVQNYVSKETLLAMMSLALKFYLPNELKISIYDLYLTLNFEKESMCALWTRNDFVFSAEFPDDPSPYLPAPGRGLFSAQASFYSDAGEDSIIDAQYSKFKRFIFSKLNEVLRHKEYACRSLTHEDHVGLFVPILRIIKHMLLTDQLAEEDMNKLIYLLDPSRSSVNIGTHLQLGGGERITGLLNIENLEESVKYEICIILDYMCDRELKDKIRVLVEFSGRIAYKLRAEQEQKHKQLEEQLKQSPSFTMQKTKQFRLRPLAQVCEMLGVSEEERNERKETNPLRDEIDQFHQDLSVKFDVESGKQQEEGRLRSFLRRHPSQEEKQSQVRALSSIIKDTLRGWVDSDIKDPKLVCAIFNLLHRQFNEQEEFSNALEKTYILPTSTQQHGLISPTDILGALGHLRSLMQVRIDKSEQKSLKRYLHILSEPRLVFHHPELLCSLQIHETVLNVMKHLLDEFQAKEQDSQKTSNFMIFQETISECCKYLCNLAKFSGVSNSKYTATNSQRMLFPHLDYLLELSCVHNTINYNIDTSPMGVANAIIRNNEQLALSLQEEQIRKVIELLALAVSDHSFLKDSEQYLEFLKLAVRASDCYIEENAKIIVTHLISNRTCLGPALDYSQPNGFAGYFTSLSSPLENSLSAEDSLPYYISLLDLLAKCAPDCLADSPPLSDPPPICSVLQKIILEEDLRRLLESPLEPSETFNHEENRKFVEEWSNFKGSILLFYEHVYTIKPDTILEVIEDSIIPDMLYALCLCRVEIGDVAITLLKYITQSVIPFLQRTISNIISTHIISEALSAKLLHATYWLACLPVPLVHKNCIARNPVSEFVQLIARRLPPGTMYPLISKLLLDLHHLPPPNRGIIILMLSAHFRWWSGYYSGANIDSTSAATPQEQHQLLELAHFLLEETYGASNQLTTKLARKSSTTQQNQNISAHLRECLHAVIHALAPDMLVPEYRLSDSSFLLLPNHRLYLPSSVSTDISHLQVLPSFTHPPPSSLLGSDSRLSPPSDLMQQLQQRTAEWLVDLHDRMECQDIPGVTPDRDRMLESVGSTISLLLNAIMSKGIFFVHNPLHNGQTDICSSKDLLSIIKNAFSIGLTKKDLRDKTWKRLLKSVSLAVLEFSSLLNNHLHFRCKRVCEELVPIPYYLLQTKEQEIVMEAVHEYFNLISNCGYKLQTTKHSSMSIEQGGENFGRQTVTLLVVQELYESFRGKYGQMEGPGAGTYLREILLPVMTNYFMKHRSYFVSDANQLVYMSMASQFELVEVAKLFHFIILHLHKNPGLFRESADTQKEIRTALEWLCRCLHPFASNISVGNIVSEDVPELAETDSLNAVNYVEDVISILIHSLSEQPPSSLTAVLPVISVLIKQIGSIRENTSLPPTNLTQVELDRRMTDLFLSLSSLVRSPDPLRDLSAYGECLTAICCTRVAPLLEESFGEVSSLYQSISERVMTASLEDEEYVHIYLPLITKYIKRCNELKTENPPCHNSDIQPIISSVVQFLTQNLHTEIQEEYQIVQSLELIVPYTPVQDLYSVWRDLKLFIHAIRNNLVSLWKSEQRLTAAEAGNQYNEREHSNLEPRFNVLLPHLLSALMLLGRFLYSREKDLLTTAQRHEGEHISLFWDLDFIFNCWQTSQYARQGLQGIIHTICSKFESMESASLLSERNELSILIQLVLQTQKKVYNERCHILLYCIKTYLDLIFNLDHFSPFHHVIESSESMFRTNNNIEYISQKLDQEFGDKHKSLSLSNSRTSSLTNWYHLPQSDSQNSLKLDLMEVGRVKATIYNIEHPRAGRDRWRKFLTQHKKRAIMRSFQSVPIYRLPWFKISNHFLETYRSKWLVHFHKQAGLIAQLETDTREPTGPVGSEASKPLKLLVGVFCKGGIQQSEQQDLYRKYAKSLKESCASILPDDDSDCEECDNIFAQQAKKKELEKQQVELTNRDVAKMIVVVLAESEGCRGDMIQETLQLGISLLKGGNLQVQENILEFLQESKEGADFFTSMSRLIVGCPVLDRSTYERQRKVYGSADNLQAAIKDDQFTQDLFRFLQLLCEGHNMSVQNYLRSQQDKTATVNLVVFTVDYLLSLQESIQNFYGQYAGQVGIDVQGQSNFKKVFKVVQQVFNTLTEYVQGPCYGNQVALSQSRLWDATSGFFYIFAKLQSKLSSEYEFSMELMKEVLDVHADMIILLLSMLEGNVSNEANSISGQMKDALVESRQNLKEIVEFCCTFIDLNDVITSKGFQSYDQNKDGVVSRLEFETALSSQNYKQSDMDYLMRCADTNQDGVIDYMEFMERFYTPCDRIGFNLSVLFTILFDHLFEGDANQELAQLRCDTEKLRQHFRSYTGCIEIIGKSKKVEKVFFQIDKSNFEQWKKSQIQESKRNFTRNLDHEISTKDKMEKFMDFCEDTIFEMKHAAMLSQSVERERESRASEHHEKANDYFKMIPTDPVERLAVNYRVHMDEVRNRWVRTRTGLTNFYSKLGLLRFILVIPILLEFCVNIGSLLKQFYHPTQAKTPAQNGANSYVPRIIRATRRFSSNLAQLDHLLRKSSMVIVFVLNLLLLFCNFDALSGIYDDSSSIVFMSFAVPETLDRVKLFLLNSISSLHLVLSGLLIWTYWQLKFPLIIFREEKRLCHAIEGNKEKLKNELEKCMFLSKRWWDKKVLVSASFPRHYWNKLVRQEMKEDSEEIDGNETFYGFDINYILWIVRCVMLTDYILLSKVIYFIFSLLGKLYSPAFFCIHLLQDVYTNFETLRTIFYSIYHNKTRLLMSIFILLVVQLIFSIIGMYLFGPEDEVSLIDIFLYLVGQIPGGNLDISEKYQPENGTIAPKDTTITIYSIAYFFAIQLVLIALIQGLIIDAFGELRKKQEDAKVAMHTKCFICGLNKETFDQNTPRGFEMHTEKEHNFPNYLFFLMHLIHKEETEYTGQESYVMDMYRRRNWEFFPVGTYFSQP